MKNINEYRAESTLNKILRYPEGLLTRKQWINLQRIKGAFVKEVQEPKIQYSRTKYNRLTGVEQQEYEKKCNEMKTGYRLHINDSTFYDITKTEFDYFNNMALADDIAIERESQTDDEIMKKEFDFAAKYFK